MALLADLLQHLLSSDNKGPTPDNISRDPSALGDAALGAGQRDVMTPDVLKGQMQTPPPGTISNDQGSLVDFIPGNPFSKLIDGGAEQGTMRHFLGSLLNDGKLVPNTGTVGGGTPSDHVPGTEQDAALSPTPMKQQKQKKFGPINPNNGDLDVVPPEEKKPDYSQPTALDPVGIEQLRQSLLTQAGQMDPNNPNGLSGRMNSPYAKVDQSTQMQDAQKQADEIRGNVNSTKADRRNQKEKVQ